MGWGDPLEDQADVHDCVLSDDVLQVAKLEQEKKDLKESSTPPQVEMKPLPSHLEYTFLGDDSTYPFIVSSELKRSDLD